MLNEQTFEKLYALQLTGMAEALKDQMGRTDHGRACLRGALQHAG